MENQELHETQAAPPRKKKKGWLTFLVIVVVLAAAAGIGYYFYERQKPGQALEQYLASVQQMDFAGMESMLQSNDLSILDSGDLREEAYTEFFQSINRKMTYRITKTSFDIQNGTAQVTARIRYIDGSDIYRETVSEFLRQIVSTALSGESLTEEETQATLASILNEKAASMEDKFSETDIVYPMINVNGQWKVISLDEETVKIMSANFKSVEEEINASLEPEEEGADSGDSSGSSASQASFAQGDSINMDSERFTIRYTRHVVASDFAGDPCLLVYYDYTNNGSAASSAMVDVNLTASQDGESLSAAIPQANDEAIDAFMSEIQPGETVNVCQAFSLVSMSEVTLQARDALGLGDSVTASQVLQLE